MNIYVGNLPHSATEDDIRELFEQYGEVLSVNIIKDKYTGDSRGFGFVEMSEQDASVQAIEALNGTEMDGRTLTVNEARPRRERRPGGGGGGRGGGYGRGGGGRGGGGGGRGGGRGGDRKKRY
jgi:cold-inducible RNA-binding protein